MLCSRTEPQTYYRSIIVKPRLILSIVAVLLLSLVATTALTGCASRTKSDPQPTAKRTNTAAPAVRSKPVARKKADGMVRSYVAYPTGDKSSSVLLIERAAPASVSVGQEFEYSIKATNISSGNLEDVVVADTPAEGFKATGSTPKHTSAADGAMRWELGKLAKGESKIIKITGSATGVGTLRNCVSAEYAKRACLAVNVVQPKLELVKTMTPEVIQCDPIIVTFAVTNNGTGTAKNVVITDNLPDGLKTKEGNSTIKSNVGDLAAGETKRYKIELKAQRTGTFTNNATANAAGNLKSQAQAKVVVRKPVLTIDKTGPEKVFIGRNATYGIKVTNTGDGEARNLVVTDTLPVNCKLVSSNPKATVSGGKLTWKFGTLNTEQSKTISVVVTPNGAGRLTNSASASAFCAETVTDTVQTAVNGIPAVLLEVVDVTDPVEVGSNTTYIIRVTNQGSADDTNIRILCNLEDTMSFVNATGSTGATKTGQAVEFSPLGVLKPKDSATWNVTVKAEREGDVRFTVKMNTDALKRSVDETEATNFYK